MRFNYILLTLFLSLSVFAQTGTYFKPPALIEGFTTTASSAGTLTLTRASQTKQIITGVTTHTVVMPDATTMTTELGRRFFIINKSSGTVTVNASGGGLLGTILGGAQAEVHLRAAGSAAGTWDLLSSSAGGGGTWGSITGTLSAQTDLQSALDLKAPLASPTFTGTITTPLTASRALVTGASSELAASAVTATEIGYVAGLTSAAQTQLDAKQARSTLTTKGDIYVATASATTARQAVGAAGEELLADPDTTNGVRYGTRVGTDNYLKANPSFEGNAVTGWAAYADAAGTSPVDCTAGSPNTTFAINSSAPILNGSYQGLATLSTGATRQGEGFSYAFSIPTKYSATPGVHQIEFDYAISGGTFVAGSDSDRTTAGDSTFTVWIYDVTNSQLIQPSTYRLYSTVGSKFVANFQNNAASTSYRLCVHKGTSATVSGSNITVKFDDFRLFPAQYAYGTPITDWVSYTPTFGAGFGTVSTSAFYSRRVGDSLEVKGKWTSGTVAANTASISVGYGGANANVTIDTSKVSVNSIIGSAQTSLASTTQFAVFPIAPASNATTIGFTLQNSTTGFGSGAQLGSSISATGSQNAVAFSVPIVGWSSSTQVSDGYDGRFVGARYFNSASSVSGSVSKFTYTTRDYDTTASYASGDFTVPSSGWYNVHAGVQYLYSSASGINNNLSIYLDSTPKAEFQSNTQTTSANDTVFVADTIYAKAGQVISIRGSSSGSSPSINSSDSRNFVSIIKTQAPTTISATEVVAARYTTAAGQSIPNTATYTTVVFGTKDFDTHNAFNSSTGVFTAPVAGIYEVTTMTAFSASLAWSAGNAAYGAFFKNTSTNVGMADDPPVWASVTELLPVKGGTLVNLLSGETLEFKIANNRTGGNSALQTSADYNYINIKRIK